MLVYGLVLGGPRFGTLTQKEASGRLLFEVAMILLEEQRGRAAWVD